MSKSNKLSRIGIAELTTAQIAIGLNIVVVKSLLPQIPTFLLLNLRFIFATIITITFCIIAKEPINHTRSGNRLKFHDIAIICLQGLCAGLLYNVLMMKGLTFTTAINASIITSILPAVIAFFSFLFLKEKLSNYTIISIFLAILGVIVINLGHFSTSSDQNIIGTLLITACVVPEALFTIIAKWHNCEIKPVVMTVYANGINALAFTPLAVSDWIHFRFYTLPFISGLLLITYSFSGSMMFILWYRGLKKITASIAGLFTAIMPISATILSSFFLKETINLFQFLGMIIVIFSIFLATRGKFRKKDAKILTTN